MSDYKFICTVIMEIKSGVALLISIAFAFAWRY